MTSVSLPVWMCLQDFRQAAKQFDFGMPANDLVGDDRILQCALSQVQQLPECQHSQQYPQAGVLLLSNDKVMQLKVSTTKEPQKQTCHSRYCL